MRLARIEIENYRCFRNFSLDFDGRSVLIVAPNAGGKTSLLSAIRIALRGGPTLTRRDFNDPALPIEIVATLVDIPPAAHGSFAGAMTFSTPPTLRVGVRATWDDSEAELEHVFGFPDDGWRRAGRDARDNLPLLWLPAWRDATRLLPFAGRGSLLAELVETLNLDQPLDQALSAVTAAADQLSQASALQQLLNALRDELAELLPNVAASAYSLAVDAAQPRDLLRQFELALEHEGHSAPAEQQSGGLSQLSVFALALRLLTSMPDALLIVDEPEQALHPHAQRALVARLRDRSGQSVMATHSANVLDRVDPRTVIRLRRNAAGDTEAVGAAQVSDGDARRLRRYSTAQTAEAFFSQTAVLFEGLSDLLAVREFARTQGVKLDAAGISLVSLDGANTFATFLELLGPNGLDVRLLGLCDADKEANWTGALNSVGHNVVDRTTLNAAGVWVCDPDLEGELVGALTTADVQQIIDSDGGLARFQAFASQPAHGGLSIADQQLRFVKKDKIRWAPLLAAAIPTSATPYPIDQLLAAL